MTKTNLLQDHYLTEEAVRPIDAMDLKGLKWDCLGAACPSSCCSQFAYSRVSIQEIIPLSRHFPIVFSMVTGEGGESEMHTCIQMKLVRENNYCVHLHKGMGCKLRSEKPLSCTQYPFRVLRDGSGQHRINVRMGCPGFSPESGQPVLLPGGTLSRFVEAEFIGPAISRLNAQEETGRFAADLWRYDLIAPGQYTYRGEEVSFNLVDSRKLYGLTGEVRDEFRRKGYMDLIYAHMDSLEGNFNRLIDSYIERSASSELTKIVPTLMSIGPFRSRLAA